MPDHLKTLIETFSKIPSREEFISAFKTATEFLRREVARIEAKVDDKIARIKEGRDGRDGVDGKDGRDGAPGPRGEKGERGEPGPVGRAIFGARGADGKDGKDGSPDTPEQVRDKLEALKGDERTDKSAIKGIEDIEKQVKEISLRPTRVGGAKGIGLYVGGSKKLLTAQQINLVAGTGISISYAYANGRNDLTIAATGTASLTPIEVTGDVDDSNTSFTADSAPSMVIVNGAAYRDGHGCSITGTAITLDNPVGTGGDIYAL